MPAARFEVLDAAFVDAHRGRFDLVFSHHVLEHVFDLDATVRDLAALVAAGGRMVHALPCGNAGRLAHWLCRQRPGGVDAGRGNRFFFEESSHLRRLRTDDLRAAFAAHGFALTGAAYGYHRFGVLRLMTEMTPADWLPMVDPRPCRPTSRPAVAALFVLVAVIAALRAPLQVLRRARRCWRQVFRFRTRRLFAPTTLALFALAVPGALAAPVSLPVALLVRAGDRREWRRRRGDPARAGMTPTDARAGPSAPPAEAVDIGAAGGKMAAAPSV